MLSSEDAKNDSDARLTQQDYSDALGNEAIDPQYVKFLTRIERGGKDQVLRYSRWSEKEGPLFLSTEEKSKRAGLAVPDCERCGSARKFEFQVIRGRIKYLI